MKGKKFTFSLCCMAIASSAFAIKPMVCHDEAYTSISSNAKWAAGQIAVGAVTIRNLETNESWQYFSDGGSINYFVGIGKVVSDNGTVIGATKSDNACYWENGKWTDLKVPRPDFVNNTGSITPDGSVICGGVGLASMATDAQEVMLAPAVWYRQPDGSFGEAVVLPHPKEDFTGRLPQYVTAVAISDDGRVVGGQMTDYTGLIEQPIVYFCDDDGNWSYKLFGMDLINPTGITLPEWPGDFPEDILMPTPEWYMTAEQLEAFMEAFEEWDNTGTPPLYQDFMTADKIEEYNQAMKEYLAIFLPWDEKFNAFMDVYRKLLGTANLFSFNNERLSPDGKYYLTSINLRSSNLGRSKNTPILFDLETWEYKTFNASAGLLISDITNDYTIFAYSPPPGTDIGTRTAYIFPQMADNAIDLYDYIKGINPEVGLWMEENMLHEVAIGLSGIDTILTEDMMCTGIPVATPDLSVILTSNSTLSWMDYYVGEVISFIFPTGIEGAGVGSVSEEAESAIRMLADGTLLLAGEYAEVSVYDLSGKKVFAAGGVSGSVYTGLGSGLYIVKATDGSGAVSAVKALVSR